MPKYLVGICLGLMALAVAGCNRKQSDASSAADASASMLDAGDGGASSAKSPPKVSGTETATGELRDLLLALERVHFPFDSSELAEESRAALDDAAAKLLKHPEVVLWVDGHTDDRGTSEYNMGLGDRRARMVVDYLTRSGVEAASLKVASFGEEAPLVAGSGEKAHAANRRVDFRLLRGDVELVLEEGTLLDDSGEPIEQ